MGLHTFRAILVASHLCLANLVFAQVDSKTEEKMQELRKYREAQYELLMDAVFERRGWDGNSIPTVEKLRSLGMDLPELIEVVEAAKGKV